ncbi:hypothetical protein, partial [Loktanella sp. S4079]|uniref:hypothetical protein n=1 Tax=Loktanella sp. S4079 TaxID=579483 RepID=UPI000A60F844
MQKDFRLHLREQTRIDHEAVDHYFSKLDIAKRDDFIAFAHIHLACFEVLSGTVAEHSAAKKLLDDVVAGLRTDLN